MPEKLRLMILSVGSLAAQNVIDALGARRERCRIIGTNSLAEAAGNFRCDKAYLVPTAASGAEYLGRLAQLIAEEQPDLVIPSRDEDVVALAMLGEESKCSGTALLVGSAAAARMWYDKVETAHFAARHALPFAPTALDAREAVDLAGAHGLPLIAKPRSGNGSRGVVLLRSTEEISRAFASRTDLIAQPFLDPPSNMNALIAPFRTGLPFFFSFPENGQYVVTVIIGPDGSMSEPYAWLCSLAGGQSTYGTRCDDLELLDVCRAYARAAADEGWRGPLNVQLKRTPEGHFVAFELNGRFGGGTAARTCLGFDEVGDAISRFVPNAEFPLSAAHEADAVQKYLRSYPIPRQGLSTLQLAGVWSGQAPEIQLPMPRRGAAKLRVLVLSVGSLAAQKMIDALGRRRERCVLIGTNSIAQASANFRCDTAYLVPQASSRTDYVDRIAEIIQQERPDIVIPARDDDVLALAVVGERYPPPDQCVLLTGSVASARMINDKLETARFAARHALPFAETADNVEAALALACQHGLPIIGKPRSGNATRGVVLLRSAEEIIRAFESHADFLVQVLLDPPSDTAALTMPYSAGLPFFFSFPETAQYFLQIVVGPHGRISEPLGTLSTQVGGKAIRTERCTDPELLSIGRAYARATADEGWRGPLNVQLKRTASGGLVAHELNGRFSGGTAARAYLGFDEIGEVINRFLPATAFPSLSASGCDVVQNYMYTEPIPRDDLKALLSAGKWSRNQTQKPLNSRTATPLGNC